MAGVTDLDHYNGKVQAKPGTFFSPDFPTVAAIQAKQPDVSIWMGLAGAVVGHSKAWPKLAGDCSLFLPSI